ncbi:MAG: amino acid adenylation domain-containing protein, partial [Candidatus Sulfotelmatobacter sp.]
MIPQQASSPTECLTLIDLLRLQVEQQPNALAYRFLLTGEVDGPTEEITYGELDLRARAIAACLQGAGAAGERGLLLYPPGLEFIAAFLACAYAGVVAVPTYPHRKLSRLETIARDARARFVLTTVQFSKISPALQRQTPELAKARWIVTDVPLQEQASDLRSPHITPETLLFLQYTSGSTGHPKGVIVSHGNVLNNERLIAQGFRTGPSTHVVGWLPVYHDMGLIGNVLHPLYIGASCTLFSPLAFLQRPMRWLEAISHFQGTVSGGPNFAFDYCVAKKEIDHPLNLSSWKVAFNGSEPVRKDTMDSFTAAFAENGFSTTVFYPCYGLAEATLFVASGDPDLPVCATLDAAALERNLAAEVPSNTPGARNLVSSGQCPSDHWLAIVHPETHQSCPEGGIGEIWFAGPSVARGYWDKPQETQDTFKAHIRNDETRYFLRTGDLGFLLNGHLFVAGRLKDLIIIRGRNLYPQDIEFTVQIAHTAVRPGSCAAFAVETDGAEKLVIVAEVNSQAEKTDLPLIVAAARRAVAEEHATHVRQVVLLSSNSIPKTSSGKIRRDACRKALASGELAVIFTSTIEDSAMPDPRQAELAVLESTSLAQEMRSADSQTRIGLIEKFAQRLCARHLRVYIDRVELDASPASLGLDSLMAMALQSEFEADLHVSLPEAFLLQQPTLRAAASELLAAWVTQQERTIAEDLVPGSLDGNLPLSSGQQRLWFLDRLLPGNPVYNVHFGLRMTGLLNLDLLQQSLTELISRHVILRTVFREVNGRPWQSVRPLIPTELELINLSSTPGPEQEGRLRRLAEEFAMQPFDLAAGPLIRFHLVALAPDRHILLIAQHHIITDGWSIMVLARELAAIYRALLMETSLGPPPELQFADYARWEQLNVARWEDDRTFWRQQLSDLPSHDLPADYPRPPLRSFRGGHLSFRLPGESSARIVSVGRAEGCTPFITLLTGYCILLARYMVQDEFAVGSFITNRGRPQLWEVIGFFTNTVVLRCDLAGAPSFRELLRRTRLVVADALRHGKLPFAEVVQMVTGVRDGGENPLFQAAFVLESPIPEIQIPEMTWQGISWTPDGAVNGTSKFDIMLALQETPETFVGALEYSSDLFEVSTIERFAAYLSTLYDNIAMHPDCPVTELSIFSLAERQRLLVEWNRTEAEVAREVCFPELFQRQAGKTPDAVAVFTQRSQVTYRELNQQANRLARYLRSWGVGLETVVALLLGRGSEFLTCMLAVFKAGGAYLPLDPHHPLLRQLQLLQQSGVRHVISTSEWARELAATVPPGVQVIDIEAASGLEEADSDLPALCRPSHLAYVIYTSGSTGTPKGAMVEHLGMLNHLYAKVRDLQLSESDVVAQTASQAFDISVWQFLAVLLVGGRVRIVSEEVAVDPAQLMMEIDAAKISIAEMVPSMLRAGLEEMESGATTGPDLSSLRRLLLTGEALPPELVRRWLNHYPEVPLLNAYGPTECSDDVAHHCISSEADLGRVYTPIGRPIVNTRLYVLDERLQPVAIGVPGELYVGGICVGRGYQNDAARTAETFIPDLYATEEGVRLYRTGDVVRWLPRGEIVFLGRRDHQVKIRGFRIELGEIEALLESQAGVKQALVLAQADQRENQRLVAYVAVREEITPEQLEQGLKQRLPEYMVPAVYVLLPSMPLTPNGKIDRQALPAVELGMGGEECYVAPRTPVEEILCGIWQEVLAVERVGVKENFFHLGGHSLLATQVMARVRFSFGIDLPLRTMFERPTVDAFAAHVEQSLGAGTHAAPPIQRRGRDGELPLSFAQERLWFLSRYELETSLYNVPVAMRLRGKLNIEAAKASLQEMVNRHEVLRTSFPEVGDGTIQDIAAEMEVPFAVAE